MSDDNPRPRGELPPEGESPEGDELDADAEAEAAELDEAAAREAEAEDDLVGAHRAYLSAVLDHFGPEAPVHPCPTCEARGYTVVELRSDPNVHRCEDCGGLGLTATGSMVEGNQTRPCPSCHGSGYRESFDTPTLETPFGPAAPVEPLPPEEFPPPVVTPLEVGAAV